jgi:hypothetical protein
MNRRIFGGQTVYETTNVGTSITPPIGLHFSTLVDKIVLGSLGNFGNFGNINKIGVMFGAINQLVRNKQCGKLQQIWTILENVDESFI